jgi:hypothetical protein
MAQARTLAHPLKSSNFGITASQSFSMQTTAEKTPKNIKLDTSLSVVT